MTQVQNPYGTPTPPQGPAPQGHGPYAPPPFPAPGAYGAPGFGAPGYGQPPAKKRTGAIVGVVVTVLVLAGLGIGAFFLLAGKVLDTAEAERQIVALTEEQAGVTVTDVTCPEDVELAAGTVTTCTAQIEGQEVTYSVEQTDDEGNVTISSNAVFVQVADVEATLTEQFTAETGLEVVSACESEHSVLVAADGLQLDCVVSAADDPTDSAAVVASIDAAGDVTFEAV
jgi:hypothetical protein